LSTFRRNEGSRACQHVFCHAGLKQIRPVDGVLKCPTCRETGEIVRHDIFPTPNDQQDFQDFLQRQWGHNCTICREVHHLHTMALGTVQSDNRSQECRHVFCFTGLLQTRRGDAQRCVIDCPICTQTGYIVHHGQAPQCIRCEWHRVLEDRVSIKFIFSKRSIAISEWWTVYLSHIYVWQYCRWMLNINIVQYCIWQYCTSQYW
jgi:hypothetical protein